MDLKAQIKIDLPKMLHLELDGEILEVWADEVFWKKLSALPAKLGELQKKAEQDAVTEGQAAQQVRRLLCNVMGEQLKKHLRGKSVKELASIGIEAVRQISTQIGGVYVG
ncbi:MAG: hypothetical protein KH334_02915 [Clostridiales bacterium]|nr:hypothetical protein [Clostridiales bacterium]